MSHQALLFCTDEKTSRLVTQVLTELEFVVELCNEPFAAVKKLMAKQFDAIVVDCDNEQNATLLFKSARNSGSNSGSLAVAVVEGQAGVAKAFRIGANLVLTKPINVEQSKGTLRVARGLLRKAEAGKHPTIVPAHTGTDESPKPLTPSLQPAQRVAAPAQKPVPAPAFAAAASNSQVPAAVASSSTFDVAPDPVPKPEPSEAAFLESIPDPLKNKPSIRGPELFGTAKESPWQPLTSPVAEIKGATSRQHSEMISPSTPTPKTPAVSNSLRSFTTPPSFGQSAGAAAAPAKSKEEMPRPATKIVKTADEADEAVHQKVREIEAAAEAARGETEHSAHAPDFDPSAHETKASRMPLIAAIVVVALGAAGYLGWSRMHISDKFSADQGPPPALHVQPPPSAASADLGQADAQASLAPTAAQTSPTTPAQSQLAANGTQSRSQADQQSLGVSQQPGSSLNGKPSAGKTTTIEAFTAAPKTDQAKTDQAKTGEAPVPEKKTPEPLAVTSAPTSSEQPVAPPLQAAGEASDQTIAGLVGSTSVRIPKHDLEVVKISQGIIEGMLIKKVRPIYPAQAMQMGKQGTVQILANISKNGSITNPKLIKGDPMLAQAAIDAVKQWKYKPYLLDGQPVEVQTQISINFKLP